MFITPFRSIDNTEGVVVRDPKTVRLFCKRFIHHFQRVYSRVGVSKNV